MLTDVLTNSLKACIIFWLWLRQTRRMVSCARITRITPLQESFTATFSQNGLMEKYVCWTKHGEKGVTMEDNEEEDFDDIPMEEPEVDVVEVDPSDDLGQALYNVRADCESEIERLKFQKMLEDHHKLLYPDCENRLKKLGTTLQLLQWKATNSVSDKGFGELLKLVKNNAS